MDRSLQPELVPALRCIRFILNANDSAYQFCSLAGIKTMCLLLKYCFGALQKIWDFAMFAVKLAELKKRRIVEQEQSINNSLESSTQGQLSNPKFN